MSLCLHLNAFEVCCYVLCWNIFAFYIQLLSDYTLIIETKRHGNYITCVV